MSNKIIVVGNASSDKNMIPNYINDNNIQLSVFDYNKLVIDNKNHYLLNKPGEKKFELIEELLVDVDGVIFFIENNNRLKESDRELINLIIQKNLPHVIFLNREDLSDSSLKIEEDVLIIPIIAREGIGIADGLKMLLKLVEKNKPAAILFDDKEGQSKKAELCKLSLLFKPGELENVKKSLENFGFSNITIIETKFTEKSFKRKESYRGKSYDITLPSKIEINMIIEKKDIPYVIQAMEDITGGNINEYIVISPIEEVIRIRTEEKGVRAVD